MIMLASCGGSSSGGVSESAALSGNWQFTMAPQSDGNAADPTFSGGLLGGFLLENASGGSASGQTVYSVALTPTTSNPNPTPCNSGSAGLAVTISGQNVTLTELAGTQTFTLSGTLSADGSTMLGTYTSTAGTAADGSACGYAVQGVSWSAISVPPLAGPIQGSFHSTSPNSGLSDQDFVVSGSLTQGENIGASNATITGTLSFINPVTNLSDYPCFSLASVNGQISGNSVILQIIGTNGLTVGQIGEPVGTTTGVNPVTFDSVQGGSILHGVGPSYLVVTGACAGGGSLDSTTSAGDSGNICIALNSATACQQPISLSPAAVTFPAQMLGSAPTTQTITLTNNSNATLTGLALDSFTYNGDNQFGNNTTDFNGVPSFTETDACGAGGTPANTQPFNLGSGQSCSITVTFSPQQSCPWLPFPNPPSVSGAAPEWCPFPQSAAVTVKSPMSADPENSFAVPITGIGLSAVQPSTPELDFGAEEQLNPPEASLPQTLSFTNDSLNPVEILGNAPCLNPHRMGAFLTLPAPRQQPTGKENPVAGLQVVSNGSGSSFSITADANSTPPTITYNCDSDTGTFLPNFQISSDTCTGTTLAPQASCSLQVAYVPQPNTDINSGLDYFLELNTLQCWPAAAEPSAENPCEIDSGRFPVELKANYPSPLRMSPGAGLNFGNQKKGATSAPLTVTLLNDPTLASPETISFVGRILVTGNYSETDDCPVSLAPGSNCTLSVTFTPGGVGFEPGTLTINYSPEPTGQPQFVYLRGTGQ
jgi:hypothetical protein